MITIEKNIPIPTHQERAKYSKELEKLKVGDSFLITDDISKWRIRISSYGIRNSKKFTIRKISSDQYRCWRLS